MRMTRGLTPLATSNTASSIIDSFEQLISPKFPLPTSEDRLGYCLGYCSGISHRAECARLRLTAIVARNSAK